MWRANPKFPHRGVAAACSCVLAAAALASCATVQQRKEVRDQVLRTYDAPAARTDERLAAGMETQGGRTTITVEQRATCPIRHMAEVRHTEHIIRTEKGNAIFWEFLTGGLGVVGGAVALGIAPGLSNDTDPLDPEDKFGDRDVAYITAGCAMAVGATALIMGGVDLSRVADGTGRIWTDETVLRQDDEPCPPQPAAGVPVQAVLDWRGTAVPPHRLGVTDAAGQLTVELSSALPVSFFAGSDPPGRVLFVAQGTTVAAADLRAAGVVVEGAAWQDAERRDTADGWRAYLATFGWAARAGEGRARLLGLLAAQAEAAWNETRRVGTVQAYDEFVVQYPECAQAATARESILEVLVKEREFEQARQRLTGFASSGSLPADRTQNWAERIDGAERAQAAAARDRAQQAVAASRACAGAGDAKRKQVAAKAHKLLLQVRSRISSSEFREAQVLITTNCRCSPACAGVK